MKNILEVRPGLRPHRASRSRSLACVSKKDFEKVQAENKTLSEEKQRTQRELGAAGAATAEMQSTLDEVQKSLEDLRVKELKAVRTSLAVAQEGKTAAREARRAEGRDRGDPQRRQGQPREAGGPPEAEEAPRTRRSRRWSGSSASCGRASRRRKPRSRRSRRRRSSSRRRRRSCAAPSRRRRRSSRRRRPSSRTARRRCRRPTSSSRRRAR